MCTSCIEHGKKKAQNNIRNTLVGGVHEIDWDIPWLCFVWAFTLSTFKSWALMNTSMHTSSTKKFPSVFGRLQVYPTSKELMEKTILSSFMFGCVITNGLGVAKNEEDG